MIWLKYIVPLLLWTCCNSQKGCKEPPEIDFGEIVSDERAEHQNGARVQYRCFLGYALEGSEWITCKGPEWTPAPRCMAPCTITKQKLQAKNLFLSGGQRHSRAVQNNQTLEFLCGEGYVLSAPSIRKCINGHMDLPSCISESGKNCSRPPTIENGDITTLSQNQYTSGSSVQFKCQRFYAIEGESRSFCDNGNWTEVPACLEPCIISMAEIERRNLNVKQRSNEDEVQTRYIRHGDSIEFSCKPGHGLATNRSPSVFEFQCRGEPIVYPECKEITCNPGNIVDGYVTSPKDVYKDGDELQFECHEGYEPVDRSVAICSGNGWNTRLECTEIICSRPEVRNGRVSPPKEWYSYEEEVQMQCDPGYKPEQQQTVSKCTTNGWLPVPKCVSKRCNYPEGENVLVHGYSVRDRDYYFPRPEGSSIDIRCKDGFSPANKRDWQRSWCTKTGWDPEPKCFKLCDHKALIPHGQFVYGYRAKFVEGNEISFSCERGYYTEQPGGKTKCTKNGWSPTPQCISRETCQKPTEWNVIISTTKSIFFLGENLPYMCEDGYETINKALEDKTTCTVNGWRPMPQCQQILCEGLLLDNGDVEPRKDRYVFNDVVQFSCRAGGVRVGPVSAQCYQFGWSPPPPICKASGNISSCQPPSNITDGRIITDFQEVYSHGQQVEYNCNLKYSMTGSRKIECVDGQWTSLPSCTAEERTCEPPPRVINGRTAKTQRLQYFHGETVKYECYQGYAVIGTNPAKCLYGQWDLPSCARLCPPPPHLPNATEIIEVRNYENGEKVRLTCKEHFLLEGEEEILCEDGKWKKTPRCIDARCGNPPSIANGSAVNGTQGRYPPGAKVAYHCDEGYDIIGMFSTCKNRSWTSVPTCKEKSCGHPPKVFDSSMVETVKRSYESGETVRYVCHPGFIADGPLEVTCRKGQWTELPVCEDPERRCGRPPVIQNGDVLNLVQASYLPGTTLRYKCQNLYVMNGTAEVRCENGLWTKTPTCIEACTISEDDMSNNNIQLKWQYAPKLYSESGDMVEFVCKWRYGPDPASPPFRTQCIKGRVEYPRCI
ncbi:complement factor H-related protein 5-like isoform X2 [Paroedura picta]|uniref:complement factor H-related protein 5-like isoform X2 n=1 Tax=Paroedura picta TaxID=143630 RepID=UPI0040562DBC